MNIELACSDTVLVNKFRSLENFNDVAGLLEIKGKILYKILLSRKKKNYVEFTIKKRSGKERIIHSPKKNLSIIQKKFAYVLSIIYNNHSNSHGFVKGRSIVSNAEKHIQQRNILNFDLLDYFHSFNFGRVRAMFKTYFNFNDDVASILANICCHYKGFLPQGAATSPIIANILTNKLDKNLSELARKYKCVYTRYADDITFSTSNVRFPTEIAYRRDYNSPTVLSDKVMSIVQRNGFRVNKDKTRLKNHYANLSVTGITVNEKLNVKRSYVRHIRTIIHCIEKNKSDGNLKRAEEIFNEKYNFRQRKHGNHPKMFDVLRGMISYLGQVKTKEDPVYLKLARRYNEIVKDLDEPSIYISLDMSKIQEKNTFVIESLSYDIVEDDEKHSIQTGQGTAFLLKGIGLITNAHVISKFIELIDLEMEAPKIKLHRSKYSLGQPSKYVEVKYYNKYKDIAILSTDGLDIKKLGFESNEKIESDMLVHIIGYPEYVHEMDISRRDAKIIGERKTLPHNGKSEVRYEVSQTIFGGNSGGPVVNTENEVVAVAVKGQGIHPNEVIPISEVKSVFDKKEKIW
ncbi:reverse transcriptase domain-containing protein [Cytobacillus sp. IB215665]|uniref:reverse transcriptase domain-containing protein n=1 Tax=Cytobacillus sp. IB215665 TaxID=3097357 RepID=UPI002A1832F8|nr:reverse transcriptase domain-containing protein [Cytobacillus sp. IB215665]MDX8366717.1 reverse transcriptase domain-containing protein [Cytobacillus sp. IB215665]